MKKHIFLVCTALLLVLMTGCGAGDSPAEAARYTPGTYTGEGEGFGGTLAVSVTVDAAHITAVEVTSHNETKGIGTDAIDQLPGQMVEKNTAQVENVSGATITSDALKGAVSAALLSAEQ